MINFLKLEFSYVNKINCNISKKINKNSIFKKPFNIWFTKNILRLLLSVNVPILEK